MTNKTPQKALIKKLIKKLERETDSCSEIDGCKCDGCREKMLIGLLYWYLELLD